MGRAEERHKDEESGRVRIAVGGGPPERLVGSLDTKKLGQGGFCRRKPCQTAAELFVLVVANRRGLESGGTEAEAPAECW